MTTAGDIVNRALVRVGEVGIGQSVPAELSSAALGAFNRMLRSWKSKDIDIGMTADYALADEVLFLVPSPAIRGDTIDVLASQGNWDANANSPALASGSGTKGYYYRVTTAGSTTLDSVTSWLADDFAVFDGRYWQKAHNSDQLLWALEALLVKRIADEFGQTPAPTLLEEARDGMHAISAAFMNPPYSGMDNALLYMPGRRVVDTNLF